MKVKVSVAVLVLVVAAFFAGAFFSQAYAGGLEPNPEPWALSGNCSTLNGRVARIFFNSDCMVKLNIGAACKPVEIGGWEIDANGQLVSIDLRVPVGGWENACQ